MSDLAVVGCALAVSVSLADELGVGAALVLGMAVILIANLLLASRSPFG